MSYFGEGEDDEGPATCRFHDDGEELGINGTEGGIPRGLGDPHIVVALVPLHGLTVDMPELGHPYRPERHPANESNTVNVIKHQILF